MAKEKWTTSAKDFELYQVLCEAWLNGLGLKQYRVTYYHREPDPDLAGCYGWFRAKANIANIGLSATWDRKPDDALLNQTALHECLHLLLHDLMSAATFRYTPAGMMEGLEEELIARLEKVMLDGKQVA